MLNKNEELPEPFFPSRIHLAIIFAAALSIRIVYIVILKRTEMWDVMFVDADFYDTWGMRIANGDWLGGKIFYDPPLYAYFLGLVYKIFGHDYLVLRIAQNLIGAGHCVAIAIIAAYIARDRRAGLTAGMLAAAYAPLVYYDSLVMKASLESTIADCGILALLLAMEKSKYRYWFLHGLLLGLAALLRVNMLAFAWLEIPIFAIWIFKGDKKPRAIAVACWLLGLAIAIVPPMIRNYHVGGRAVLVSSYLGQNFYTGNNPYNTNRNYERLPFVRANPKYEETDFHNEAAARLGKKELSPDEASSYWFDQAMLYIKAQPVKFTGRIFYRLGLFWNAYEIPDSDNMDFMADNFVGILKYLPGFGIIAPLGLLGIALTFSRRKKLWPIYVFIALYTATIVAFFVFSRYRMSVVGSLIAFAGAGAIGLLDKRRKKIEIGIAVLFLAAAGVFINRPTPYPENYSQQWRNLATLYWQRNDPETAIGYYRKAVGLEPEIYENRYYFAHVLRTQNRCDEAIGEYVAALKIAPEDFNSYAGIGFCRDAQGDFAEAEKYYSAALQINPKLSDVRIASIRLLIRADRREDARVNLEILKISDPENKEIKSLAAAIGGMETNDEHE